MKPYGAGLKPIWTCGCCRRDERKSARAAEKEWAQTVIAEGQEELDQRAPCEDTKGFCMECYTATKK